MRKIIVFWSAVSACGLGFFVGVPLLKTVVTDNFHVVAPGQVYRSGQPSPADIERYKQDFGIVTILNLRGIGDGVAPYDAEKAAADKLGVKMIDFAMSSTQELSPKESMRLVAVMKAAPKPLLIHCSHGANRTGFVSALYLAGVAGVDEETAEDQLSIRYGHIGVSLSPTYAMDRSFEAAERELGYKGS